MTPFTRLNNICNKERHKQNICYKKTYHQETEKILIRRFSKRFYRRMKPGSRRVLPIRVVFSGD